MRTVFYYYSGVKPAFHRVQAMVSIPLWLVYSVRRPDTSALKIEYFVCREPKNHTLYYELVSFLYSEFLLLSSEMSFAELQFTTKIYIHQ